jgi:hypothetical protein
MVAIMPLLRPSMMAGNSTTPAGVPEQTLMAARPGRIKPEFGTAWNSAEHQSWHGRSFHANTPSRNYICLRDKNAGKTTCNSFVFKGLGAHLPLAPGAGTPYAACPP